MRWKWRLRVSSTEVPNVLVSPRVLSWRSLYGVGREKAALASRPSRLRGFGSFRRVAPALFLANLSGWLEKMGPSTLRKLRKPPAGAGSKVAQPESDDRTKGRRTLQRRIARMSRQRDACRRNV